MAKSGFRELTRMVRDSIVSVVFLELFRSLLSNRGRVLIIHE